jgi:hypothetical protein
VRSRLYVQANAEPDITGPGSATDSPALPKFSLALSPHTNWSVSLGPMADRIRSAKSTVLFAVMEPTGGRPVLASLRSIAAEPTVFSYGTVESDKGNIDAASRPIVR